MSRMILFCGIGLMVPVVWAGPIGPCPAVLNPNTGLTSNGCSSIVTINLNGSVSIASTGQPPFDNNNDGPPPVGHGTVGDYLIGVINNSSSPVSTLSLTGSNGFLLDGDENIGMVGGVLTQVDTISGTPGAFAINQRSGQTISLTTTSATSGTVVFTPSIPPGANTYFAVEGLPNANVPEPSFLPCVAMAFGLLLIVRRRTKPAAASHDVR